MKNKKILFLMVLLLIVSLSIVMVACGENKPGENAEENNENNDNTGTGDNNSDTFNYASSAVESQLNTLQQGNGYLIKYRSSGEIEDNSLYTNISLGAKGNIYYIADETEEMYYDLSDNTCYTYYEKLGNNDWTKTITYYGEYFTKNQAKSGMQAFMSAHSFWLTYYDSFKNSMGETTKTSAKVAGRDCDKFTFSAAALTGEGLSMVRANYACYVDKQTSMCLKWEYSYSVAGETQSWTFECTEFNTNPSLTLPTVSKENTTINGRTDEQGGEDNPGGENVNPGDGDNPGGENVNPGDDDNQGGNNQGNEDATTYTKTLATSESIINAIGNTYKVAAASGAGAISTVASDGTYYYANSPSQTFQKRIGDLYYPYTQFRDGKYHKMGTPNYFEEDAIPTFLTRGIVGNMFQFNGEQISYQTVENVTIANRSAKKYTFDGTNIYGYSSYHEEITIDDITGACLKYYGTGRAGDGFTGGTRNKVNFEVTELVYGQNNATVIAFLNNYVEKIDVFPWDTDFFSQVGLTNVNMFNDAVLEYTEWMYDSSRDSESPYYETQFKLYSEDMNNNIDEIKAFLRSFYDNGANYNYEGEIEDTYYGWYDEDESLGFTGYTSDYEIDLYADYISSAVNKYWRISVSIYLLERD